MGNEPVADAPAVDMSIKQGEKISINFGGKKQGAAAKRRAGGRGAPRAGGGMLAPPPADTPSRRQMMVRRMGHAPLCILPLPRGGGVPSSPHARRKPCPPRGRSLAACPFMPAFL